jgi:hypothetical protein
VFFDFSVEFLLLFNLWYRFCPPTGTKGFFIFLLIFLLLFLLHYIYKTYLHAFSMAFCCFVPRFLILQARVGAAAHCVRGRKRAGRRGREEKGEKKRAGGKGREEKGRKKRAGRKGREEKGGKKRAGKRLN